VSSDPPSGNRRRAWGIWVAVLSVYLLAVFHRSSLGVAGILAAERFGVSAGQLSTFVMVQLLVYAAMQVPVGALLDRFGSRRMLLTGLALMTLAQTGFALAESYPAGLALRVLLGAGDAMIFISVLRVVALWFPDTQVPVVNQLTGMLGQVGGVIAAIPLSASLEAFGWTASYLVAAGCGVVLAAVLLCIVRDAPPGRQVDRRRSSARDVVRGVQLAWRQPGTRLGLWIHFASQFSATVVALLWGFPFFVTVHEVSATTAGALITVMVLSAVVVGPLVGRQVARHPFSRSTLVLWIIAAMAAAWTVVLLWPGPAPLPVLVALMVVVGVGGPGSMVGFDMARTFNPAARLGSATGIVNVGGFVASLLTVVSIGLALDLLTPGGSTDYRPDDFRLAMAVQIVPWALGSWQIWRLRRRTRRQLAQTDPDAYDALKAGFAGSVVEGGD
jgi:sugar phosphate permease